MNVHKVVHDYTSLELACSSNIKVYVRFRPPEDPDTNMDFLDLSLDEVEGKKIILRDPDLTKRNTGEVVFQFDRIFKNDITQKEIFEVACKPQIDHVLDGYNSCCFAYGQTGSGKTYSMFGGDGEIRGMIPRAAEYLFEKLSKTPSSREIVVFCSFLEIYNDQLRDLGKAYLSVSGIERSTTAILENTADLFESLEKKRSDPYFSRIFSRKSLTELESDSYPELKHVQDEYNSMNYEIHEDVTGHVFVKDLSLIPVSNSEEVMAVIIQGLKVRAVAETKMNATSSRSHTVFSITVAQREKDSSETVRGVLNLIDLAGSERLKKSESQGTRLREALHINSSLTALGKVVMALDPNSEGTHVPYRDSKLTRMLQNSLGGNSYTTVVAAIHPHPSYYEECLSTLQFANRCRNVRNNPRVNYVGDNGEDKDRKIKSLMDEVASLRQKVLLLESSGGGGSLSLAKIANLLQKLGIKATLNGDGDLCVNGKVLTAAELSSAMSDGKPDGATDSIGGGAKNMLKNAVLTMNDVKSKKMLSEMHTENEHLNTKMMEKKRENQTLQTQVREMSLEFHSKASAWRHKENQLTSELNATKQELQDLKTSMTSKHQSELSQMLSNNQALLKEHHNMLQAVPANLKAYTKSVAENIRFKEAVEEEVRQKFAVQMREHVASRETELANLKAQYEMFLREKDVAMSDFYEKFLAFRTKKKSQTKALEHEIVLLYEYAHRVEDILKNAANGLYGVRQTNGEAPATGLFNRTDGSGGNTTRLAGLVLPKGLRPVNPLDNITAKDGTTPEPLALTKQIVAKHQETLKRLHDMKEDAFQKTMGLSSKLIGTAPLDPLLERKIQSLFLSAAPKGKNTAEATGLFSLTGGAPKSSGGRPGSSNGTRRPSDFTHTLKRPLSSGSVRPQPQPSNQQVLAALRALEEDSRELAAPASHEEEDVYGEVLRLRAEVTQLRDRSAAEPVQPKATLNMAKALAELEDNETVQYIRELEESQDRLQRALKDSQSQLQSLKVSHNALLRSISKGKSK